MVVPICGACDLEVEYVFVCESLQCTPHSSARDKPTNRYKRKTVPFAEKILDIWASIEKLFIVAFPSSLI